jgi:tetratricopeptide (TPR) repeat protein
MNFPKTPRGIKSRIKKYEDFLKYEKRKFGFYHDGGGVRYAIGPLYMLMGDVEGAVKSFNLFKRRFPDDIGEPFQYLIWTLALYKKGQKKKAETKLMQTMLLNLYLFPHVFGEEIKRFDFHHSLSWNEKEMLEYLPEEYENLWDEDSKEWAKSVYYGHKASKIRAKYIELETLLSDEPVDPRRSELVKEISALSDSLE